jgi:hypothetical protein
VRGDEDDAADAEDRDMAQPRALATAAKEDRSEPPIDIGRQRAAA